MDSFRQYFSTVLPSCLPNFFSGHDLLSVQWSEHMAHGKWRMVNGSGRLTLAVAPIGDLQLGVVGAAGALAQLALGVVGASVGAANRIRVLLMLLLLLLLLRGQNNLAPRSRQWSVDEFSWRTVALS